MKPVLGQYHYAPHRNWWGVWQWDSVTENGASGTFIKDFRTKEDGRDFQYALQ